MSIAVLIEAAEFLERREREQEHGYATSLPVPLETTKLRATTATIKKHSRGGNKKTQGNRSTHNELEKNSEKNTC
ncbi:CLUMA_CG001338, isoform D [Clunio marinus]|uniref:CLUMA_CG001338, isoform D n=1 Tax=Clunio marinus TaxID=568069 RepID=A0A1J1HHR1_9DIPT|nr:CLUMA_CG001338, isoform D [Clunio marinus]